MLLRFTPIMDHAEKWYRSFVVVNMFVKMSALFSLVSICRKSIRVIFKKLKFTSAVFLKCPSFVLRQFSVASQSKSLTVLRK